jgi:hypothetical protein
MHNQKKTTQEQDMSSEECDYNPTLSEEFLKDYRLNEIKRREALHETETSYNTAERILIEKERSRLIDFVLKKAKLPVQIGDRVWCSSLKRDGTIVDLVVSIDVWDDDWYSQSRLPTPLIGVEAVIQPDPSPKLKRVRDTYNAHRIYLANDPSRTVIELFSSDRAWNEDWDDVVESLVALEAIQTGARVPAMGIVQT